MHYNDAVMRKELPKLKAALTRAINSKNPVRVLEEVKKAHALFDRYGWPDCHHRWERAKGDAEAELRRLRPTPWLGG